MWETRSRKAGLSSIITFVILAGLTGGADVGSEPLPIDPAGTRKYLDYIRLTPKEIDDWSARRSFLFGKHDPEMGFLLDNRSERHGVDNSIVHYQYDTVTGARQMLNHAAKACRINTYGDSFVQCEQVNDGETWQEVLASHLDEPVRNYGTGNSIYWAYRRMLREEKARPAKYIIFNLYENDHHRNVISWQRIPYGKRGPKSIHPTMPYVRVNPSTGEFTELSNVCPTPESVYKLCDLDWIYATFKDDFYLKIVVARENLKNGTPERSYESISRLAADFGMDVEVNNPQVLRQTAETILKQAGMYATLRTIDKVAEFCKASNRKLLFVLSYGSIHIMKQYVEEGTRFDQEMVDLLDKRGYQYTDLLEAHARDFANFKIDFETYHDRYYTGHYNPAGNYFYAHSIKDKLVEMMNPKPTPYRENP